MDQQAVQTLIDRLKRSAGFSDVKLGGTQNAGRNGEVAFSVTFTYLPPEGSKTGVVPPAPSQSKSDSAGSRRGAASGSERELGDKHQSQSTPAHAQGSTRPSATTQSARQP
jgi:hypothetical protein